jgi:AcrR family transcriptional regulator
MSATVTSAASHVALDRRSSSRGKVAAESRFERRLAKILQHATDVFYDKGYEGASMRDLSRASGMSLAGMYYYFESKDRLLYLIQKHTFRTIVDRLKRRLQDASDPEQRVRLLIENHLEYFLSNQRAMKVLSHEDDVLTGEYGQEVAAIKREYYRICVAILDEYQQAKGLEFNSRLAVLSLFGMMNWIYTWYNPRVDANADEMAREMGNLFLNGVGSSRRSASRKKSGVTN